MSKISVPEGYYAVHPFEPMNNAEYGNRNQWFTYELQTNEGATLGPLVGVTGGTLEWHANAQVKGGGKIAVQRPSGNLDWLKVRVKITMHIQDMGNYPLGVFIPSAPAEAWDDTGLTWSVELLDKTTVLAEDAVPDNYSVPAGANVTDRVRDLIVSSGERAGSITQTNDTLTNGMTWEAGTSKLTIINDLLQAADFFALYADGNGHYRVEKHEPASKRPMQYNLLDNAYSIYLPTFTYDKDHYAVPNKVVAIGVGSGEDEAWTSVATNTNPDSPYSYQRRGRWIVDTQRGVEATSQANLDNYAQRRLAALSSPQGSITIQHAPLPWVKVNDVVHFRRETAGIDIKATVASTKISLDPKDLQHTELLEVVDLS